MGQTPIPPYRPPSRLEQLKRDYVRGALTLEAFEEAVDGLLRANLEDAPAFSTPFSPVPSSPRRR